MGIESARREHRAALGMALGLRAEEIRARVLEQLEGHAEPAVVPSLAYDEHRRARILFGTLLLARWLVTGEAAGEDEAAWISRGGEMGAAEGVSMAKSTRGYYYWRDCVLDALREEAAPLHSPPGLLELALEMTRASCDASLLRMSRAYDHELRTINSA